MSTATPITRPRGHAVLRGLAELGSNVKLTSGLVLVLSLVALAVIGPLLVDTEMARPISAPTNRPPSPDYLLGTDGGGRDLLAVIIASTPQTLRLGLLAGLIGTVGGTFLGLVAGFFGGWLDRIISTATDVVLTIPPLAILLIVAASVRSVSVEMMAFIIAALAWMHPARSIRAQVLSLRERAYVEIARISGMGDLRIALFEVLPNLLPLIMSSFVAAVSGAILAALGLEALGFGPQDTPTLGMTVYWSLLYGAFGRNMWWWWAPPIVILAILFIGLFLISVGLDEAVNPRLRRQA
ncbi:MAG TPA: ABC transporter permease [Devosia sp.]|jgi:peptide/nickel transport system permease protein|uniref:ABC transporter permease n=1 Tax=Devosia sp. TaxID=1871048 RepID=UPI002DDD44CA|nr:ABC transporter permease [Devosia sp.]HEV2518656.1 ABC transporter permease [Devosia sp.]